MRPPAGARARSFRRSARAYLWLMPALVPYMLFVLFPLSQTVRYSFYDWNGIGVARWVGLDNYRRVLDEPELYSAVIHSVVLIGFFTMLPIVFALVAAATIRELRDDRFSRTAQVVLFLPQIVPLVGSAIAWTFMYSQRGPINRLLDAVGLDSVSRPWLADFDFALIAVGFIGTWVATGFCTILFLAGIGKIDPTLYEAARIDGAGAVQQLRAVTIPGLRREIVVAATITTVAALASFDIVYVTTQGGPGYTTMVPGVKVVRMAFTENRVGAASALAVVLIGLVICFVAVLQRFDRPESQ